MKTTTSRSLAVVLGLVLAPPAMAQQQQALDQQVDADTDQDGYVVREEAMAHSRQRFAQIAEGGDEITLEQFMAALPGAEAVGAEAETLGDPETTFERADSDQSGGISLEEWLRWRESRFNEASGDANRIEAGLYKTLYAGAMHGVDSGGNTPTGAVTDGNEDEDRNGDATPN